jgi:hypothetical protein
MNVAGSTDNDDPLIQRVREWADEAVAWTTEEIYRRYSQLLTPFGMKGRHHMKQVLHYHIEFLVGSLATSEPEYFRTYVRWLDRVLSRRGVPTSTLPESLSLLLQIYQERLGSTDSARMAASRGGYRGVRGSLLSYQPVLSEPCFAGDGWRRQAGEKPDRGRRRQGVRK